jgi:transposase
MTKIRDAQWSQIYQFLQECPEVYAGQETQCRRFIEAIHWILRTGAQWRELPAQYGQWNSVYKRFARWCDRGIWEKMHLHFADDPDMENVIIDSTIVRAHPCAAGASKKTVAKMPKPWGEVAAGSAPKFM